MFIRCSEISKCSNVKKELEGEEGKKERYKNKLEKILKSGKNIFFKISSGRGIEGRREE